MAHQFFKYFGKEDHLQYQVVQYIQMQYPDFWRFVFHVPMETYTKGFYQKWRNKTLGVKPGLPDLMIFKPADKFVGLAIELKILPNRLMPAQEDCLKMLTDAGWMVAVCYDFEFAQRVIDGYFRAIKNKD